MKLLYRSGTAVHVTLSRRNLTQLLQMLDAGLTADAATLVRRIQGIGVFVTAEEDGPHYAGRIDSAEDP